MSFWGALGLEGGQGKITLGRNQFLLMYMGYRPNYNFLVLIEAEIRICPSLGGDLGAAMPPAGGQGMGQPKKLILVDVHKSHSEFQLSSSNIS